VPPTSTPTPALLIVNINFQPPSAPIPGGYLPDYGDTYAARNGYTYGWNMDHTDVVRQRGANPDLRLDTLSHFHAGGVWQIAVPPGNYSVTISIGDATTPSQHTINVEGVNYWASVSLSADQFLQQTQIVTVSDGQLTIDQGGAAEKKTRINYVEIAQQ
jgi:hypothetical protein